MSLFPVNLAAQRFSLAILLTLGTPAWAQQTVQNPQASDSASGLSSDDQRPSRTLPENFNPNSSMFGGGGSSFDVLPAGPQPIIMNNNSAQWRRFLDDRKNWALLTPKEILNVPTPESILNLPDAQDDRNLTAEQKFLKRQDKEFQAEVSTGLRSLRSESDSDSDLKDAWHRNADGESRLVDSLDSSKSAGPEALKGRGPFAAHDQSTAAQRNVAYGTWTSPFGVPITPIKKTPEQLAGLERFRAMMEPLPPDIKPSTSRNTSPLTALSHDADLQSEPPSKEFGRTFSPLENTMGKPTTLQPLPGLGAPAPTPKKVSWVQPPPWTSQSAQSQTFPQRQF
jgi:hypothetical protein